MNRLLTAAVAAAALWMAACSNGGSTITPPPPAGKFTLASLNGTYAFMTSGEVFTNGSFTPTPLARVGSFQADSKGGISGGVEDVNASGTVSTGVINSTSTSGSLSGYTVDPSGHGTLTLSVTSSGITSTIKFGFVLTSGSDGLSPATDGIMIDETSTQNQASTGSGNFVLQNTMKFQTTLISGTYVFDFSGLDAGGFPESIVGEVNVNAGAISGGIEDSDDDFALSSLAPTGAGSFNPDPSNIVNFGRGLASIAGQEYAFYIVDPTRVRLISTTTTATIPPMLSGDAILQTSPPPASLSGGFAFVVAGANQSRGAITRVGRFSVSGSSVPNTSVLMDTNDSDNFFLTGGTNGSSVSGATISLDSTTGRGTLMFRDSSFNAPSTFVFYLTSSSSGVFQETSQVNGLPIVVADGSIEGQSGNPFTSNITGSYAMNWSGLVTAGGSGITDEEDLVGQVTVSNLSLSGASDMFQFTSFNLQPLTNLGTKGQINFNGGTGAGDDGKRVVMTVSLSNTSPIDMVVYIVSPQTAFFANRMNDSGRIIVGILKSQK